MRLVSPHTWLGSLLVLVLMVSSFLVIKTAYQTRQLYSGLQEARATRDALTIEWGRLLLERGAVGSDTRLDALARTSLGLKSPDLNQTIVMERP